MDDMNYDDPELVAALDPENAAKAQELKQKDEAVCEVSSSVQDALGLRSSRGIDHRPGHRRDHLSAGDETLQRTERPG